MKLKRILATVLALAMVLSMMSFSVLADDANVVVLESGTYTWSSDYAGKTVKEAEGAEVVFDMTTKNKPSLGGADVTFEGITFNWKNEDYQGLQHSGNLTYNNCEINGQVFLYGASETFNNCTFNQSSSNAYNVWTYGAKEVSFNNCTFNSAGKSVLVYHESQANSVEVVNTTFNASTAVAGKAAIEIDTSLMNGNTTVTVDEVTTANGFSEETISGNSLWNVKKDPAKAESKTVVSVAEETVYAKVVDTEGNVSDPVANVNGVPYASVQDAINAAQAGDTVTILEGTYGVPKMRAGITVVGEGNVLLEGTLSGTLENLTLKNLHIKGANAQRWAYAKGDLVFENVTFDATSIYALHFDGITEGTNLLYKDCTIIGWAAMGGSPASCVFEGCTIKDNGSYGVIRTYFDAEINDCTFDVDGANPNDVYQDGIHAVDATVKVNNCTNANGDMKDVINVSGKAYIYVDDELALAPEAKIGEEYYAKLTSAIADAQDGDVIDLLGNVITFTGAIPQKKSLTIKNGTINANAPETFNVFSSKTLTFDTIELNLSNFTRSWLYPCGDTTISFIDSVVNISDGGNFISGEGNNNIVVVKNTEINAKNIERLLVNVDVDMDNSSVIVNGTGDNALRNVYGTITDTNISIDGAGDNGLKNSQDKLLTIDGSSKVVITGSKSNDLWLLDGADVTVGENASLEVLTSKIEGESAVSGDNFVSKADSIYVQYRKVDKDTENKDNLEGADKYEIVLVGGSEEKINELASADLTFDFVGNPLPNTAAMAYFVKEANGVSLTQLGDRFMFNYNGVDKHEESGLAIVIGTITVEGYGSYTLGTKAVDTNAVYATEIRDNIVDGFEEAATLVINNNLFADDMFGKVENGKIDVPTRTLTINIDFPNKVDDNAVAYQDMKVEITGNIDGKNQTVTYDLGIGDDAVAMNEENSSYVVTEDRLVLNNAYTVTVSGAGYRTARYTVTMTDHKSIRFWNNVMDNETVVEEDKHSEKKNFLAGDIVKDNNINIYDLSAVVSYFGTENATDAYNAYAKYDLNRDGVIDSKDVAYVLVSWGE